MSVNPTDFLNKEQTEIFHQWRKEVFAHLENGTHLMQRVAANHASIKRVAPEWAAMWECPYEKGGNAPMKVTQPSGQCLGELMRGGIHPPVEAHWESKVLLVAKDGQYTVARYIDADEIRIKMRIHNGGIAEEYLVDGRRPNNEIAPAMDIKEAHEYIFAKDVPQYAWGRKYNKPKFCIVPIDVVPAGEDRQLRNSWHLSDNINLVNYTEMKAYQNG